MSGKTIPPSALRAATSLCTREALRPCRKGERYMKATGERWERCLWQKKRPERVAAVGRRGRLLKADDAAGYRNRDLKG